MEAEMIRERLRPGLPGLPVLLLLLVVAVLAVMVGIQRTEAGRPPIPLIVAIPLLAFAVRGFLIVAPNEAAVLQLFGAYAGTAKIAGLRWTNPFYTRRRISLRVR